MSEYFSNYPKIAYDITGTNTTNPNFTVAVNLMVRNKIRDAVESDVTIFYPYIIPEGMRPDVLAYQYYGDTQYTWSVLLVNNIIDPYWEWPLSYKDFRGYVTTKYGSIENSHAIKHYETSEVKDSKGKTISLGKFMQDQLIDGNNFIKSGINVQHADLNNAFWKNEVSLASSNQD